jgi:threonine/homoserine/homoserine lactone efflux protein|tara:strand:- start:27815 stop:28486 length:672 start_codon:yes stop_codon:yes gene_type:complete
MDVAMSPSDLQPSLLVSLLLGGFVTAFLHAALPTHWLPFVLVGRAQRWSLASTLWSVLAAGLAHIAVTAVVGGLIVAAGLALDQWVAGVLPYVSAGLLFVLGLFYLTRATLMKPVPASGPELETPEATVSQAAAFWGLVAVMAASPGEVLLPLYLSSAEEGLMVLALLTVVLAVGTVLGMAVFTTLARAGASILRLERWARYEGAILGLALIALGLLVVMHQH